MTVRAAFVLEQTLGHVTHARNLAKVVSGQAEVRPTWLSVPYEVSGAARYVPLFAKDWSVRASWRARRALRAALLHQSHDALVFHTQVTSLFSSDLMRSTPTVISLDATPINYDTLGEFYGHRPAGNGWLDRRKYRLNRQAFHAATALVTWSDWARRSLVADYGVDETRVRVIPPGAAPAFFDVGDRRHEGSSTITDEQGRVRLLFVGGDFRRKGGPLLLECLRGRLGERCHLDVVTGEDVISGPNVSIHHGLAPNSPELLRLFAAADAFVLPSRADTFGIVLMEANAAGLPVVTTAVGALGEIVVPGKSGLIVRPGDPRDLTQALDLLVGDADLRRRLGRGGRCLARQKFDAGRNGRALLDLVIQVAQARSSSRRAACSAKSSRRFSGTSD